MNKRKGAGVAALALTPLLALGLSTAFGSSASGVAEDTAADSTHPECYNEIRLNDPDDFCYKTIGPWNSTKSSDEEVRSLVSVEDMTAAGRTTEDIQRYYPDYNPAK